MYRLIALRRQGGSTIAPLPKRAVRDTGWPSPAVPLRPVLRGDCLVLAPDPALREISRILEPFRSRIREAIVYGSYASGDWDPAESDIDLFIVAEKGVEEAATPALNGLLRLRALLVSAQFFTPEEARRMKGHRYLEEVRRTGVALWAT